MKKTSEKLKEKMVQKSKKPKQRRSRADTEQKLIDVALELIRNKGVLAGLNLREVADGAGVNRGNIYHYFGSRQELLRSAINRQFGASDCCRSLHEQLCQFSPTSFQITAVNHKITTDGEQRSTNDRF